MYQERIVQPPRIAAWLVDLFVVQEQTGMQQQILDEFSDMVLRCGIGPARRWYWRRSAKTIAGLIGWGFRTAPWLIVAIALCGALVLLLGTSSLQRTIMAIIFSLNHHVTPYYDSKGADAYLSRVEDAVLIGSLLESLIVGCFVAATTKGREMIATMTMGVVSLVMTATIFWVLVATHAPINPVLFPHIMIDQLSGSLLMIIGGIIVREVRSPYRTSGS